MHNACQLVESDAHDSLTIHIGYTVKFSNRAD